MFVLCILMFVLGGGSRKIGLVSIYGLLSKVKVLISHELVGSALRTTDTSTTLQMGITYCITGSGLSTINLFSSFFFKVILALFK